MILILAYVTAFAHSVKLDFPFLINKTKLAINTCCFHNGGKEIWELLLENVSNSS
jgi:hypothetical protein